MCLLYYDIQAQINQWYKHAFFKQSLGILNIRLAEYILKIIFNICKMCITTFVFWPLRRFPLHNSLESDGLIQYLMKLQLHKYYVKIYTNKE